MRYSARPPDPRLREHVEYLWMLRDAPAHARERIVPSGTLELVINLHADAFRIFDPFAGTERTLRGAIVSGCYARAFEIDTTAHAHIVGVHFKPGGAARLLGAPPGALANDHVALDALWGRDATELRERLIAAPRPLELLEQALLARLRERPSARVAAAVAALDHAEREVGNVARALGLSRRRFIEIFTEDVGMTPKRYAIVRRFQRALVAARRWPSTTWASIAVACGYYDQAHLCRDWSELTGVSPTEFVGARDIEVKDNHVALPRAEVKSVQDARRSRT
ncbi:MAG TPA: helix-turn-helix domain-containing protein [Kofleriaceae bacterium]|nr:helix-turn-helix domain-containing protein [Kofleriaceae bacterium]